MKRYYDILICLLNTVYVVLPRTNCRLTSKKPCVGIARTKRWHRANRLNLQPPIEVLTVLLKEDETNRAKIEMAQMDELLL